MADLNCQGSYFLSIDQTHEGVILDGDRGMPKVTSAIQGLAGVLTPHCNDHTTLVELTDLAQDSAKWKEGYNLFQRIRQKTLAAQRTGDQAGHAQYLFEEACATTLYNLSSQTSPFEKDVPFYVVARAFALAHRLGLSDSEIVLALKG